MCSLLGLFSLCITNIVAGCKEQTFTTYMATTTIFLSNIELIKQQISICFERTSSKTDKGLTNIICIEGPLLTRET